MIRPWSVVSKLPAIFLLFSTLPEILQAKIHRCLREFDPSNCNALEEVWAFDAQGQECIEMLYGGCGKPKRLSNRFETHEECMRSCGDLRASQPEGLRSSKRDSSVYSPTSELGRGVPGKAENDGHENAANSMAALGSVLSYLAQESSNHQVQTAYPGGSISAPSGVKQPNQMQSEGGSYQARQQSMSGTGPVQYMGQQPLLGSGQMPSQLLGQNYYISQPQTIGSLVQPPVYGVQGPRNPIYTLNSNPPSTFLSYGIPQALYQRPISPMNYYPVVQNIPG